MSGVIYLSVLFILAIKSNIVGTIETFCRGCHISRCCSLHLKCEVTKSDFLFRGLQATYIGFVVLKRVMYMAVNIVALLRDIRISLNVMV